MSRTLKWVLGILAVLVVVAIIVGGVWVWQNRAAMMTASRPNALQPGAPNGQYQPFVGPRGFNNRGYGDRDGWGFRGPMMMGRGRYFGPFGWGLFFLGGLFRLIIPLGLLALVAFVFYQLGRRSAHAVVTEPRRENPPADNSGENVPRAS